MPQRDVKVVSDVEVDEISLVDRPANQHAAVVLAKRATQEDPVTDFYNEDGSAVDVESLQAGDVVFDADGAAYSIEADEQGEEVGKSAFFESDDAAAEVSKGLAESLKEELSKALASSDTAAQGEVLSKALEEISKAEQRALRAENIAKAERDLRLEREYVSKADEYNLPVDSAELGPVLMRMADSASYDDCAVIHKALTAAGNALTELGHAGMADNFDPMAQLDAALDGHIEKSDSKVSKAGRVESFFTTNPGAYDEYRRELGLGR